MQIEKFVTDTELVRRTRVGERSAFALLMARYRPVALRTARAITRSDEAAREAVQEASLRAYVSLDRLREPERLCEWLRGIVRNVCRERVPVALAWDAPESEPLLPVAPDTALLAANRADDRAVREAIALLAPGMRGAVQRFYFEGWSIEETAQLLGVSVGAIKVRLHQARRRLKPLLENRFPEHSMIIPSSTPSRRKFMSIPVRFIEMPLITEITHDPVTSKETAQMFLMKMTMPPLGARRAILADETGEWFLALTIESVDFGMALAMKHFDKFGLIDLTIRLLEATGGVIESVELQPLEKDVPIAVLTVRTGEKIMTVEARPTDALAFVVKQGIPLRVATPLMRRQGWHMPDPEAIVARIQADETDGPFLARVVQNLLKETARWNDNGVEHLLEPRENAVWNGTTLFDKNGNPMPIRTNSFPSYIPPEALPAIIASLKRTAHLDPSVTDQEQDGDMTVDYEGKPVTVTLRTTPGPHGETLFLRCNAAPKPAEPTG